MTTVNNIEKIRAFYKEELPTRIPFDTHPLKDASDYAKELYCTMLAVILQYENDPMREQLIFLERVVKGIRLEISIQSLMQKAKTIDTNFAKEFYEEFVEQPLAENFVVDALVMTNCREKMNTKQLEFILEMIEALLIKESHFRKIAQVTKQIITTAESELNRLYELPWILEMRLQYYVPKAKNTVILFSPSAEEIMQTLEKDSQTTILKIYNSEFKLSEEYLKINTNKLDVYFINCQFHGGDSSILLDTTTNVIFERCTFDNFKKGSINIENCKSLILYQNKFSSCGESFKGGFIDRSQGGIVQSRNKEIELYVIENEFMDCYSKASESFMTFPSGAIFNGSVSNVLVQNNVFNNCLCIGGNSSRYSLFYFESFKKHSVYPNWFKESKIVVEQGKEIDAGNNTFIGENSVFMLIDSN